MNDLDEQLASLRALPGDPRLADIDVAVLPAVARRRERAVARRSMLLAGIVAIVIGGAGSIPTIGAAGMAAHPVTIGMSDYAPSRLLER